MEVLYMYIPSLVAVYPRAHTCNFYSRMRPAYLFSARINWARERHETSRDSILPKVPNSESGHENKPGLGHYFQAFLTSAYYLTTCIILAIFYSIRI